MQHLDSHSSCNCSHSHQNCARLRLPNILANILCFLLLLTLVDGKWHLRVVLLCVAPMTNGVENFSMHSLAICTYSLKNCLFKPLGLFVCLGCCVSCRSFSCMLAVNPLSYACFADVCRDLPSPCPWCPLMILTLAKCSRFSFCDHLGDDSVKANGLSS